MDDGDPLPHEDVPEQGQAVEERRRRRLVVHDLQGQVVDLQPVGEVADPFPVAVGVGDHQDLVASLDEALRQLVHVALHAPHVGVEEVRHHADAVGHPRRAPGRHPGPRSCRGGTTRRHHSPAAAAAPPRPPAPSPPGPGPAIPPAQARPGRAAGPRQRRRGTPGGGGGSFKMAITPATGGRLEGVGGRGGGDGGRVRPRVCGRTCRLPALPRRFSALPGARPISGHGRPVTTATGRLFPPSHLSRHAAGRSRPPACRSDAAANGRPANASRGKRSSQSGAVAGAGRVLGRGGL